MAITNSLKDLVKLTVRKVLITVTLLLINFAFQNNNEDVQSHHGKHQILTTIKIKNIRLGKLTKINQLVGNSTKKLPVTIILGDSIVKEVKGWDISENNNNGANTDDMKSYIQPAISNDPECIALNCGTIDLRQNTSAVEIGQKMLELVTCCKINLR